MATATEIRNRALRKLGVLRAGKSPTTQEATDADAIYTALYAWLEIHDAVTWDDDESIPNEAEIAVTKLMCAELADEFGVDEARYQRLQFEAYGPGGKHGPSDGAFADLLWLAQNKYVPTITEAVYY